MLGKSTARLVTLILVALIALMACGPEPPGMSLLAAVDQGNVDAIRLHMESGTDPDESFVPPGVPWAGASALHIAVIKEYQEVAQVLLDNGADIDTPAQDQFRGSPLEWAAFFGLKEMAVFLVEAGADLNSKNAFGTTPLDATVVDNPFIPQEQREAFEKSRDLVRDYLVANGAKSDRPLISLLEAVDQRNVDAVRTRMSPSFRRASRGRERPLCI